MKVGSITGIDTRNIICTNSFCATVFLWHEERGKNQYTTSDVPLNQGWCFFLSKKPTFHATPK